MYRFEFPERPGRADALPDPHEPGWNISLFHYRNHGADYGRVLAGMQVPQEDDAGLRAFLEDLGYAWTDEKDEPGLPVLPGLNIKK